MASGRPASGHIGRIGDAAAAPARWRHAEVVGRLVELSSHTGKILVGKILVGKPLVGKPLVERVGCATSVLTLALALVRDAQRLGETTAWVGVDSNLFFPPDAARSGVDLAALPIVRAPKPDDVPRAAERLVRSGAFGLVVLDLTTAGNRVRIPPALLNRLAALAREHEAAVICLTEKSDDAASLGPLVSLRAAARREAGRTGTRGNTADGGEPGGWETNVWSASDSGASGGSLAILDVLRDRRRPGRWQDALPCRAPEGVESLFPGDPR